MPLSDELLDERVRRSLEELRTGPIDVPAAAGIVRRRAATRSRRRRAAAGVGAAALVAGVWVTVALQADGRAKVDTEPAQTTETTTGEYGFSPVTPLLDEPLGDVPRTFLAEVGGQTFSADIVGGRLGLQLGDGVSSGSSSGDQMHASALDVSSTLPPAKGSSLFLTGATRAEVARVELVFGDRPVVTQPTISVAAFPTIRFFIFEVPALPGVGLLDQAYVVSAYDAEGRLLTDSERVAAATDDFQRAMDERAGGSRP
jgi:hypothetical protein